MSGFRNSNVQPAASVINITKTLHHNYHYTIENELTSLYANLSSTCYEHTHVTETNDFISIVPFGGYWFSMLCATWDSFVEDVIENCVQLVGLTSKNVWMCRYSLNR